MTLHPEPKTLDFLLVQVSRLHRHRAHELLHKRSLHRGQPPVIFALQEQDGLTRGELPAKSETTPATTTKMIQRMEKAGFVQRRPDISDQRVSRVYLTKVGHAVYAGLEAFEKQMDHESLLGFSQKEPEILRGLLLRVHDNLSKAIQENLNF